MILVLLLAAQAVSQELNSTLHTTVYDAPITYTDEMVLFTCVVRGANSMHGLVRSTLEEEADNWSYRQLNLLEQDTQ